jgi:hypothetical protein
VNEVNEVNDMKKVNEMYEVSEVNEVIDSSDCESVARRASEGASVMVIQRRVRERTTH